ncbi:MAG: phosphoribosylamine--glycine ligase [Candidatus Poseidoniales archaeon]|jgi:phosphoribosylamine--glycine ligase|tara:strand:- start:2001 stop:3275 length:1275 start_codon:yes stop_codon:yes gene_type:complete
MALLDVLIIGNGGREHALALGLNDSNYVNNIHIAPGNVGTSEIGTNHNINILESLNITKLASDLSVDLVVIGPEMPLVNGIADDLKKLNIPCFGPVSIWANLEGSKRYAKELMQSLHIPTADYVTITEVSDNHEILHHFTPPWVIKRDVLAGGKGVTVTTDKNIALSSINEAIKMDGYVLVEEFLEGEEASILVMMDESNFVCLPPSQDHKRLSDGDKGPNTGGMGAYAPAPIVTPSILQRAQEEIIEPMHHYLRNQDSPYRGCLYVGLMIDPNGAPKVVEFNVRLGDPETQVTIPLIASDLGELLFSVATGNLSDLEVMFHNLCSATVVLASHNYPINPTVGDLISGNDVAIEEGETHAFIHYAGTTKDVDGNYLSSGGRVLAATGIAPTLREAVEASYQIINNINLKGSQFRSDIAFKAFRK